MKIVIAAAATLLTIPVVIGFVGQTTLGALSSNSSDAAINCTKPVADIPPAYCALYVAAAPVCPGLDWSVLAAIGKIETDHGRLALPGVHDGENYAGAGGPMQFLAPTFADVVASHQLPPGGTSPPSRYNLHDAVYAAAFYLCDSGAARGDLRAAIFAYNHAQWYVNQVLDQAAKYAQEASSSGNCTAITTSNPIARAAIAYACKQLGLPYVWGGNGPDAGHTGFDCSGLTKAAYAAAGITLPRTAQTQFDAQPRLPDGTPLQPGDLVFYGSPGNIHHVGLFIGGELMINAPTFGQPVQIAKYRYAGDDYAGATRPTKSGPSAGHRVAMITLPKGLSDS